MNSRTLLVYFSLTDKTRETAEFISIDIECDIERIKLQTDPGDDIFRIKTQIREGTESLFLIEPPTCDLQQYGTVIIGMPVWENDVPPPIKSFLLQKDWRGVTMHPFFSSGGIHKDVLRNLQRLCPGARLASQLFLIFDLNGNYLGAEE